MGTPFRCGLLMLAPPAVSSSILLLRTACCGGAFFDSLFLFENVYCRGSGATKAVLALTGFGAADFCLSRLNCALRTADAVFLMLSERLFAC